MKEFRTMEKLAITWAKKIDNDNRAVSGSNNSILYLYGAQQCKYDPSLYRGGWVIPKFGYSTERIMYYVNIEFASNPLLIRD